MIIPAGKPLVSIPAFIVITFEATVLFGCLFTLIGMLCHCRPCEGARRVRDPRFSDDVFGMVVRNLDDGLTQRVRNILTDNGASRNQHHWRRQWLSVATRARPWPCRPERARQSTAIAFPWDIDMVDAYFYRGYEWNMMTVPDGAVSINRYAPNSDRLTPERQALRNPYPANTAAVAKGEQMFNTTAPLVTV